MRMDLHFVIDNRMTAKMKVICGSLTLNASHSWGLVLNLQSSYFVLCNSREIHVYCAKICIGCVQKARKSPLWNM